MVPKGLTSPRMIDIIYSEMETANKDGHNYTAAESWICSLGVGLSLLQV